MDDENAYFCVDGSEFGWDEWGILCYDCTHWLVSGTDISVITAVLTADDEYPGVCDDCGA